MSDPFEILASFLDHTDREVEGRGLETPPPAEVLELLRQLARGKLAAAQKKEVFDQLRHNRHWIAILADEVKALRALPGEKT
jgi:hypothetical protein